LEFRKMNFKDESVRKLVRAIDRNDIDAASTLISNGVDISGSFWLSHAASHGRVEMIRLLLDAGADIDQVSAKGDSACQVAIRYNEFLALQLLVQRGANVRSLLKIAASYSDERISMLLLDAGAPIDNLKPDELMSLVSISSSVAVLKRLLALQVDFGAMRDVHGRSLCHQVIWNAHPDADLEPLLRALADVPGIDIDATNVNGMTPLHFAVIKHSKSAVRLLVELGADIDCRSTDGRSAVRLGSQLSELLIALGADVRLVDKKGQSMCHAAILCGDVPLASAFVAAGGDLDQPDNDGDTPRMLAIHYLCPLPTAAEIDGARQRIAKTRLDFVRNRAVEICIGLQPLGIDALQLCEIMMRSFGALGSLIAFHQWWTIATKVKHFRRR
jgi:ankyrin repeat protein